MLGENAEKYMIFIVPKEKVATIIDKNRQEITKSISYILKFIDSARFMASYLSNLVNNLSEEIMKCQFGHTMIKNVKHVELNISIATVFLNTQTLEMI